MLWTITLNATIDHTYQLGGLATSESLSANSQHTPSGKGFNVSRALATLSEMSIAVVVTGADTAARYLAEGRTLGFMVRPVPGLAATRQHATILTHEGHILVHARERGEGVLPEAEILLWEALSDVRAGDSVAICGSQAPGYPSDLVPQLLTFVAKRGAHGWLDTSGQPLALGVRYAPFAVKVNAGEFASTLGLGRATQPQLVEGMRRLVGQGVALVCVTDGVAGLLLGGPEGVYAQAAVPIDAVNAVGSGDATLAALMAGQVRGLPQTTLAAHAAAAGAANALSHGAGSFAREEFDMLVGQAPEARFLAQ